MPTAPIIVNLTGYALTFRLDDGQLRYVPPSKEKLSYTYTQPIVAETDGITFIRPCRTATRQGTLLLDKLERKARGKSALLLIVGDYDAAQAYPGRVVAPIPVPEDEGLPFAEQRFRLDMFISYGDVNAVNNYDSLPLSAYYDMQRMDETDVHNDTPVFTADDGDMVLRPVSTQDAIDAITQDATLTQDVVRAVLREAWLGWRGSPAGSKRVYEAIYAVMKDATDSQRIYELVRTDMQF